MNLIFQSLLDKLYDNFFPFLAAILSFCSMCISLRSKRIAKKALSYTELTYKDKQSNFAVYLIDSFRFQDKKVFPKIILLNVTINNKSDTKNTFRAILDIEYLKGDNTYTKVSINHDPAQLKGIKKEGMIPFNLDIRLDEKYSESKWLSFVEPGAPFNKYKMKKSILRIIDGKNNESLLSIYILKNLK